MPGLQAVRKLKKREFDKKLWSDNFLKNDRERATYFVN